MPGSNGALPKPPDQRRRRNATPGFRQLPAEGRKGPAPKFPLADPQDAELVVWRDLWKLPQAVEWQRLGYPRVVARYVRMLVASEEGEPRVQILVEIRQLEDRLGLSPRSLGVLRWEVADPEHPGGVPQQTMRVVPQPYVPKVKAE